MASIIYFIPAALGALLIIVGFLNGYKLRKTIRNCTEPATGTVMGFKKQKMKSGDLLFPIVAFVVGNQKITTQYGFGNAEWKLKKGDTVDLRYNPKELGQIYLYHEQSLWQQYAPTFFVIVGGIMFLLAYMKLQ